MTTPTNSDRLQERLKAKSPEEVLERVEELGTICWAAAAVVKNAAETLDDLFNAVSDFAPSLLSEITKLNAEKAETIEVLENLKRAAKDIDDCCKGRLIEHGQFMFVHSEDCPIKLVKPLLDKLKGGS